MKKRILDFILALSIIISIITSLPVTASNTTASGNCGEEKTIIYNTSGKYKDINGESYDLECSDAVKWFFDGKDTLVFKGNGRISGYGMFGFTSGLTADYEKYPISEDFKRGWEQYINQIKKVYIGEGVTYIGAWVFNSSDPVEEIYVLEPTCMIASGANYPDCKIYAYKSDEYNSLCQYASASYTKSTYIEINSSNAPKLPNVGSDDAETKAISFDISPKSGNGNIILGRDENGNGIYDPKTGDKFTFTFVTSSNVNEISICGDKTDETKWHEISYQYLKDNYELTSVDNCNGTKTWTAKIYLNEPGHRTFMVRVNGQDTDIKASVNVNSQNTLINDGTIVPPTQGGGFTDINESDDFADDVKDLVDKGILTGYDDGSFKPYNTLSRAEAAVILCRLNGNFNLSKSKTIFTDVDSRYDWASGYIAKAVQLNLISGVGNSKYEPGETLTYEQFITMIIRWLGLDNNAKNMNRKHWADGFIAVADEIGLLDDISVANYASDISRAHASVIANIARDLKGNVEKEEITETKKDDSIFENKIHTSSNTVAVYKKDGSVLGDVDGLSCSLYAPDCSYDGISTTVKLKEISTKLYGEGLYNDTTKDSDNAYIYLGINTDNYGYDLGLIKNNYSHCKNYWRITNGGLSIPSRYKKFKHEEYVVQYDETYIYKVVEKDDGNVEVTNYYINDNSKNNELTLSMKYDSIYHAGKKENGLVFEIYNNKGLIFQSIIMAKREQNALFSRIVSATNSIVTDSRYKDWSKASDDSNARYIYQLSSSSNIRKDSLNKGYQIDNYRNNHDGRDDGLKIENVVFYDTFLYKNSKKIELVTDSSLSENGNSAVGILWIYPNKDINYENITTNSNSNPIISITEQYMNGKVYDTVNISN